MGEQMKCKHCYHNIERGPGGLLYSARTGSTCYQHPGGGHEIEQAKVAIEDTDLFLRTAARTELVDALISAREQRDRNLGFLEVERSNHRTSIVEWERCEWERDQAKAELAEARREMAAYQVRVDNDALRMGQVFHTLNEWARSVGLNTAHPITADRFSR